MKKFITTLLFTTSLTAIAQNYDCNISPSGPDAYEYQITVQGDELTILQSSSSRRFRALKSDLKRIDFGESSEEEVLFNCSREVDDYKLTISVSEEFVIIKQQSAARRYQPLAFERLDF